MGKPFYRAFCKNCDHTVKTDDSSTWMHPFFLPERCPKCHKFHSKHALSSWSDDCLYAVEYGFREFVPDPDQAAFSWLNPLTWKRRGEWRWKEWDDSNV